VLGCAKALAKRCGVRDLSVGVQRDLRLQGSCWKGGIGELKQKRALEVAGELCNKGKEKGCQPPVI